MIFSITASCLWFYTFSEIVRVMRLHGDHVEKNVKSAADWLGILLGLVFSVEALWLVEFCWWVPRHDFGSFLECRKGYQKVGNVELADVKGVDEEVGHKCLPM